MRSKQQNDDWYHRITRLSEGESELPINPELARHIWEQENALIDELKSDLLEHIQDEDSLRQYLGFKRMDANLWATLSVLIYSLLERDDISNLDTVIRRIREFIQMCPHFYELRFSPDKSKAKQKHA